MASASDKLLANLAITHYDFDPGATTATDIGWVDMRDFDNFACSFFRTVGTAATTFKIIGNSASNGSGTDVTIKTHSIGSEPDATGDYIFLECTGAEIAQEGSDAGETVRYLSASVSVATNSDEGVVTYVRGGGRAYDGLSSDTVA